MSGTAEIKIFRFDPSVDSQPRFDKYGDVPYEDRTVLEVLQYIYDERDPTLAFRSPCTYNRCGGCAMTVNGDPVLACEQQAEAEMTIEPHHKFEVIKDLVIDFDRIKG